MFACRLSELCGLCPCSADSRWATWRKICRNSLLRFRGEEAASNPCSANRCVTQFSRRLSSVPKACGHRLELMHASVIYGDARLVRERARLEGTVHCQYGHGKSEAAVVHNPSSCHSGTRVFSTTLTTFSLTYHHGIAWLGHVVMRDISKGGRGGHATIICDSDLSRCSHVLLIVLTTNAPTELQTRWYHQEPLS